MLFLALAEAIIQDIEKDDVKERIRKL